MKENSRRTAAFIIAKWLVLRDFPQTMLPDGADRAFVQDLVYTVIRRLRALRRILGEFVHKWPKGELEALLYVGAAQILYMDGVPDFAAVNETVEAAKASGNPSIAKVVNGTLRNLIRRKDEVLAALAQEPVEVRESFPGALVRRWTKRFGEENTAKLCALYNEPACTYLARKDGSFVELERGKKVSEAEGYQEGDFIVQDPGTRPAIELMDVKPDERVLDACAAPGGKTVQLAWRGAKVTACEVNPKRRARLEENLERLRKAVEKSGGEIDVIDSLDFNLRPRTCDLQPFSKILVDAPCSNTGVLRRRPDARWNWSVEKLAALVELQAEILDKCAALTAPGGRLVYSTCSIEPEENELQVGEFLKRHTEFRLVGTKASIPFESGHDGAFAAAMEKENG